MLEAADEIHSPQVCEQALQHMVQDITRDLGETYPLVLAVMGGQWFLQVNYYRY